MLYVNYISIKLEKYEWISELNRVLKYCSCRKIENLETLIQERLRGQPSLSAWPDPNDKVDVAKEPCLVYVCIFAHAINYTGC